MNYRFEKEGDGWYIASDLDNLVSVRFKKHAYRHTGKVRIDPNSILYSNAELRQRDLPEILRNLSKWTHDHYHYLAMPKKKYKLYLDGQTMKIERLTEPHFTLTVDSLDQVMRLPKILRNLGVFILHNDGMITKT